RSPDSSFASLPPISARVLAARQRVRPQPVWKLRSSAVFATVSLALIAIVLFVGISLAADWLTPYRDVLKVARPVTSRIHFGKEPEGESPPPQGPAANRAARQAER
ncbi:MAG: hypothetical protein JST31_06965, partial [Actinobacteria bacterium]|nr:hypothetical protein [Actinomycetota bacterium]